MLPKPTALLRSSLSTWGQPTHGRSHRLKAHSLASTAGCLDVATIQRSPLLRVPVTRRL